MKPAISIAIAFLLSFSLIVTASAGTITTTTVTTKTITTKSTCGYKKHYKKVSHKHYKRYKTCSNYGGGCASYVAEYDDWDQCPGGAYNCYFDLQGNYMRQTYLPVGYGSNVKYACLADDDPASCSGGT